MLKVDGTTPKMWRFVRGHDKPIYGSCAIYFPGGIVKLQDFRMNQLYQFRKGRISSGGAQLLSCCDRVLACDEAQFYKAADVGFGMCPVTAWGFVRINGLMRPR